jgi:pilus assembly protein CpaF
MSLLKRIEQSQQPAAQPEGGTVSKMRELRVRRQSVAAVRDTRTDIKTRVQNQLIAEMDPKMDMSRTDEVRGQIEELFDQILTEENLMLSRAERQRLFESIVAEILGYGPIEPLLGDDTITEIMVNGAKQVFIERAGRLHKTNIVFENDDHVMRVIDRIVAPLGRRIDESSPYVNARLPDGSRVNAIIPPLAINGPALTIRKFSKTPLTVENLIQLESITPEAVEFLHACVIARLNIVISGGTGSGKTTLLNVLSGYIPDDERIVTIENAAELQMRQEHVVTLESRPPNIEGKGEVTIRDLVVNCLRMRPDRIVVGECRSGEALDMLQAMNTGHDGSLTTAHSNSPRDTLARLETMCLMSGMELPVRAIREQVASAIELIVHEERMRDGSRKIVNITEVQGMEGDIIVMQDVFTFEQTGIEGGKVIGRLKPTGIRPKFMDKIEAANVHLPPNIFGLGQRLRY